MNKGVDSMNKMMEMYSPSHKKRVMAEVIEGYAQNGKGGSPRLALKGLFEGKKTLPKKVDAETFEKYGFNAEQTIAAFHAEQVGEHTKCPKCKQMTITDDSEGYEVCSDSDCGWFEEGLDARHDRETYGAEQVGEPLPESPLEDAPSTVPSPIEPTNANFSADNHLQGSTCNYCGSDNIRRIKGYKCMNCANEVNYHAEDSPSPSGPSEEPEPAEATGSEPSNENFSAEYEEVMRDVENLSDDDYVDFCYHWGIDPDDIGELSSFVMENKDSPDVQGWIAGRIMGFDAESLVEEPAWIPAGDGNIVGQQNFGINMSPLHAESFNAENCVSCETPDWFWVGGLCSDSGELKCIACCYCDNCHNRYSQLESGEIEGAKTTFSPDQKFHDAESQESMILEACGICDKQFNAETLNADGYCGSCCDTRLAEFDYRSEERVSVNNEFDAESNEVSKNAQIAIGLTALGVGLALWKSDSIMNIIDKIKKVGE